MRSMNRIVGFFFNDTATTEIYTLSLHDALPICPAIHREHGRRGLGGVAAVGPAGNGDRPGQGAPDREGDDETEPGSTPRDRKSTRLNSSHANISYAVFCLKKKKTSILILPLPTN